jgi:acyl-homoserine lactone acylase PvdQ
MRRYLDAFAAGINAYAKEHADQINDELSRYSR